MKILDLNKETTSNILESLLKRSPNSYGEYEARVAEIIEEVRKTAMQLFLPIQSNLIMQK